MNISELFDQESKFKRLARRRENFKVMCAHAAKNEDSYIVETGTAWDPDNWEGQGQSTLVWDWLLRECPKLNAVSIDIREEASAYAKKQTTRVEFLIGDSPVVLNTLPDRILTRTSVLYLDSFDWTPELNLQSSIHHLGELCAVWAKLPLGCMIVVDDRHGNDAGKHLMVEAFMTCLKYKPVFKNHQIGWIK